jgi:predicted nuclease of predicted toxin-antitoxin system
MKFLANENFPLAGISLFREAGYDVAAVIEETPGAKDDEILARANREKRIIVTFDRDYGELIYKLKMPAPAGVIYLRFHPSTPTEPAECILALLSKSIQFEKKFTVVERDGLRKRPLLHVH